MSLGLTYLPDSLDVFGKTRSTVYDCAADASYPAGGYPVSPANIGFRTIIGAAEIGSALASASGGYAAIWDTVNGTIRVFNTTNTTPSLGPGVEVTTGASLAGVSFRFRFDGN